MSTTLINKKPASFQGSGRLANGYEKTNSNAVTATPKYNMTVDEAFKLFSLDRVRMMSGNENAFIQKVIDLFVELAVETVYKMRVAIENNDIDQIKRLAHKIKPSLDIFDVKTLYAEIRELENTNSQTYNTSSVKAIVDSVIVGLESVIREMKRLSDK